MDMELTLRRDLMEQTSVGVGVAGGGSLKVTVRGESGARAASGNIFCEISVERRLSGAGRDCR